MLVMRPCSATASQARLQGSIGEQPLLQERHEHALLSRSLHPALTGVQLQPSRQRVMEAKSIYLGSKEGYSIHARPLHAQKRCQQIRDGVT